MPGKFIGYTAAKGAYLIDVAAETVSAIFENTEIMQCKTSYNNSKLGILLHSGDFKVFKIQSLALEKEAKLIGSTNKDSSQKPQMVLSERLVYITSPETGELITATINNLSIQTKLKVSKKPYRITIFGHESDEDH